MSIKKMLVLAAAGLSATVATAAMAGGPEVAYAPSYAGLYIEGNVGYAYRPWQNNVTTTYGAANLLGFLSSTSNINGGFTGGADLGYQFNQFFSIEGGWYYLPKASATSPGVISTSPLTVAIVANNITGGIAYAAVKGTAPVYENLYIFGKLGAAYTYNHASVDFVSSNVAGFTSNSNYWNPLLAAGIQYYFTPNWSVNAQYTYVPGYDSSSANRFITPAAQLITAGIGYKFLM